MNRWKSFVPSKEDCNTRHSEQRFKELYSCTRSFINSVNSLPKQSRITRTRPSKQIGEDLQNLETLRRSIQQQMEREQKTAEPNSEIKQLQRSLKEIETQIVDA